MEWKCYTLCSCINAFIELSAHKWADNSLQNLVAITSQWSPFYNNCIYYEHVRLVSPSKNHTKRDEKGYTGNAPKSQMHATADTSLKILKR